MRRWSVPVVVLLAGLLVGGIAGHSLLQGQTPKAQAPAVTPVPKEMTSYRDVVKKVLPAVVSIEGKSLAKPVKAQAPRKRPPVQDEQIPPEFRRFFEDFGQMPFDVEPSPQLGFGSGFVVDPKGVILTNNHVVDGAETVLVTLQDGRTFTSKNVKKDPLTDLAIVRVEAKEPLPSLPLGDSGAVEIGDRVLAVGAPFRLRGTVTSGIISSKGRNLGMNKYEDFLQTDAAINPGNSGGPLVNLEGQVIGINSAIKSRSGGWQGIGLAVSSNLARNVMEQLEKNGAVRRGYLGVHVRDIPDRDVAARLGVPKDGGVLVAGVADNTPGAKAGLKDGDVITALDGKPVRDGHDLQIMVASLPPGKTFDLNIVRDGKPETLKVTIEEQPKDFFKKDARGEEAAPRSATQNAVRVDKVGVKVADLTKAGADRLGFRPDEAGALVVQVDEDSIAAGGGLQPGVLVTKVDRKPVKSAAEFKEAVEKASLDKGVLLRVESPENGVNFVLLKAPAAAEK
jgi:serine protease Do